MHYGTFDLSDEPIFYPKNQMQDIIENKNLDNVILRIIGEKNYL